MKKYFILTFTLLLFTSCGIGAFIPYANNNYGIQTQVVLDRANYRIVDNVEVVIEVNNFDLKRKDVEKSAMGELMRRYKLTGSQAFINVTIEEIDRQNTNLFYIIFGLNLVDHKQHVAARATIIEFLPENGDSVSSIPSIQDNENASNEASDNQARVVPQSEHAGSRIEQTQASTDTYEDWADSELAQKRLSSAERTIERIRKSGNDNHIEVVKVYKELYERTKSEPTETAIDNLGITTTFISSLFWGGKKSDEIKQAFKKEKNINRRIEILVEYARKNVN